MPKKRQSIGVWMQTRKRIYQRDGGKCARCQAEVSSKDFRCDHIKSGKNASNADSNLRILCRRCHALRLDKNHRGLIAEALRDGIIPANWRELVWED